MSSVGSNASMLRNYKEPVQWIVRNNEDFTFMNQISGTPVYWEKIQLEVLAMVKQLDCPTFFLSLSCADFRGNDLVEIITKLKNYDFS